MNKQKPSDYGGGYWGTKETEFPVHATCHKISVKDSCFAYTDGSIMLLQDLKFFLIE